MYMIRSFLLPALIFLSCACTAALGQEDPENKAGKDNQEKPAKTAPEEATLDPKEVDRVAKLLGELERLSGQNVSLKDLKKQPKIKEALRSELDKIQKSGRDPLKMVTSWWHVFSSEKYTKFPGRNGRQINRKWIHNRMGRELPVVYQLLVPSTYRSKTPCPAVLCLHPKEGKFNSEDFLRHMWSTKELQAGPILLVPEFPDEPKKPKKAKKAKKAKKPEEDEEPEGQWSHRRMLYATLQLLGSQICQDYNVDHNRLFLDGYADGGTEAWRIASAFADIFAGVIIRGALPPGEIRFEDFLNTRFLLVGVPGMELDSKGADALAKKMKAAGVDVTVANLTEAPKPRRERDFYKTIAAAQLAFLEKPRNPYPDRIDWTVKENNTRRSYFAMSTGEIEAEALKKDPDKKKPPRFAVKVDRAANKLVIQTHRILGLMISLNDRILDLDKDVTFEVNGKVLYNGRPSRSLEAITSTMDDTGDWSRIYPWSQKFKIPRPEPEPEPEKAPVKKEPEKKTDPDTEEGNGEGK